MKGLRAELQAGHTGPRVTTLIRSTVGLGTTSPFPRPAWAGTPRPCSGWGWRLPILDGCSKALYSGSSCTLWGLVLQVKLHLDLKPDIQCASSLIINNIDYSEPIKNLP